MADEFLLYTVTSRREPFYAVVEPGTGRVWTAPTKDGAMRQARDAGITQFTERTITREYFLRSLGIADDPQHHAKHEPETRHEQPKPEPATSSSGTWFVPGTGGPDADVVSADFSYPRAFRSGKNALKLPKGSSPFAPMPIIPPVKTLDPVPGDEDILIVPSTQRQVPKVTPFTDAKPEETPFGNSEI